MVDENPIRQNRWEEIPMFSISTNRAKEETFLHFSVSNKATEINFPLAFLLERKFNFPRL